MTLWQWRGCWQLVQIMIGTARTEDRSVQSASRVTNVHDAADIAGLLTSILAGKHRQEQVCHGDVGCRLGRRRFPAARLLRGRRCEAGAATAACCDQLQLADERCGVVR